MFVRDRLVIRNVNKLSIQGGRLAGHNDITWGQANSNGVPPDQKSTQTLGASLNRLYAGPPLVDF
jgi:hypothetical protein